MAKLRDASAYRRIKRAYTRKSKYRSKSFVRGIPGSKVVMFDMGNKRGEFTNSMKILAKQDINLRHNAIEAARVAANKHMESTIGRENFKIKIRAVPHHIMRENPLATGAGADRLQTGMKRSFGKAIGFASQIKRGKPIMQIFCNKEHLPVAKEALRKAISKFPISCTYEAA